MTALDMQILFQSLLETSSPLYEASEKPDTDTIMYYINLAQTTYIKEKYLSAETFVDRTLLLGANIIDLGTLVTETSLSMEVLTPPFNYSKILSNKTDEYWHVIKIFTQISRTKPDSIALTTVQLNPINIEFIDRYVTTINNIPIILVPVYTNYTPTGEDYNEFLVVYDKYTGFNTADAAIKMIYLKKPKYINLDTDDADYTTTCELASYLHRDITKLAVNLFEAEKYKLLQKNQDKTVK